LGVAEVNAIGYYPGIIQERTYGRLYATTQATSVSDWNRLWRAGSQASTCVGAPVHAGGQPAL